MKRLCKNAGTLSIEYQAKSVATMDLIAATLLTLGYENFVSRHLSKFHKAVINS